MPTRVQGQRDVALTSLPFRGIAINDASNNTAAVQVYASDSGILFINEFGSETIYTLPVVSDCEGKIFHFYSNVAQTLIILGGTNDVMCGGGQTTYDKMTLTAVIGGWGTIVSDGSSYYFIQGIGTWAAGEV